MVSRRVARPSLLHLHLPASAEQSPGDAPGCGDHEDHPGSVAGVRVETPEALEVQALPVVPQPTHPVVPEPVAQHMALSAYAGLH